MIIKNKEMKDKKSNTYTYTLVCRKCGNKVVLDQPKRYELALARLACVICEAQAAERVTEAKKVEPKVVKPKAKKIIKKKKKKKKIIKKGKKR